MEIDTHVFFVLILPFFTASGIGRTVCNVILTVFS